MFYKVIKDNKVIDVLDKLTFLKYQKRNNVMLLCSEDEAQAILSSDQRHIWHEETLYNIPEDAGEYDTVRIEPIDRYEYEKLSLLNMKSVEEILDTYTLMLVEMGVL